MPNFFTINGKSYPSTETVHLKVGQHLLVRFIGSQGAFIHQMHIHGGPFTVVAEDGVTLPESARYEKDTVSVGPGERYDVIWPAREPGSGCSTATSITTRRTTTSKSRAAAASC